MNAYAMKSLMDTQFYKKKNAELTKENGSEDFDNVTDKKGDVELDCSDALFFYGGRDAITGALRDMKKPFVIQSICGSPNNLAIFVATVGAGVANLKSKRIIMITPADSNLVANIGEEYLYRADDSLSVASSLYDGLTGRQLKDIIRDLFTR